MTVVTPQEVELFRAELERLSDDPAVRAGDSAAWEAPAGQSSRRGLLPP